jgi:hypothetical protein
MLGRVWNSFETGFLVCVWDYLKLNVCYVCVCRNALSKSVMFVCMHWKERMRNRGQVPTTSFNRKY